MTENSIHGSSQELGQASSDLSFYDNLYMNWTSTSERTEPYQGPHLDNLLSNFPTFQEHVNLEIPTPPPSDHSLDLLSLGLTVESLNPHSIGNDPDGFPTSVPSTVTSPPSLQQHRPYLSHFPTASTPESWMSVSTPPQQMPSPPDPLERDHSESILACLNIIRHLDMKIRDRSIALDEVMRVNKSSICEMVCIMNLEDYHQSSSCPLLISIALGQIVTLFESSIGPQGSLLDKLKVLPGLSLGAFQVDPEEQIGLRAEIIRKEIRRTITVLETFTSAPRNHSTQAVQSATVHQQWLADMARRLRTLVATVEES